MFQARAASQHIVRDVEHVVRLVVRQVELEQPHAPVDRVVQTDRFDESMDQPDSAGRNGPRALGQFVVNVAGGQRRAVAALIVMLVQPLLDPPLVSRQTLSYRSVHSKTLPVFGEMDSFISIKRRCTPRVFEFFMPRAKTPPRSSLG